jgi:hypothetical protein
LRSRHEDGGKENLIRLLLLVCALALGLTTTASAATGIVTRDAQSNGGGGTATLVNSDFEAHGCAPAVSYAIGTQPLAQGGFRTVPSSANDGSGSTADGSGSDYTNVGELTTGTMYYWGAILSCGGQAYYGAQKCFVQKGSINEEEIVDCPGQSNGPPAGGAGAFGNYGTGPGSLVPPGIGLGINTGASATNGPIVMVDAKPASAGGDLMAMNADGSHLRYLTRTRNDLEKNPRVSPNGQWVAYAMEGSPVSACLLFYGCFGGSASPQGIYVRRLDGHGGRLPVTPTLIGKFHQISDPVWAPNGKRLAFICANAASGASDICAVNLNGGGFKQLTHCRCVKDANLTWNPKTNRIGFVSKDNNCDLKSVGPRGGAPALFTAFPTCQTGAHTVAPNGAAVVVETGGARAGGCCFLEVTAGTGGARYGFTSTDNGDWWTWPAFSPNGQRLAVLNTHEGTRLAPGVYSLSTTNSSDAVKLHDVPGHNPQYLQLDWGPAAKGKATLPRSLYCAPAKHLLAQARARHSSSQARKFARAVKFLC